MSFRTPASLYVIPNAEGRRKSSLFLPPRPAAASLKISPSGPVSLHAKRQNRRVDRAGTGSECPPTSAPKSQQQNICALTALEAGASVATSREKLCVPCDLWRETKNIAIPTRPDAREPLLGFLYQMLYDSFIEIV
jgi:hypothetical protein